ncbi:MAG: response regulator [Proteobacteria bacterium]|nr:response regulator [Pseudomonadota bacterium]
MPGMDGMEVLARIKSDDKLKSLPVIIQSAKSAAEDILEGMKAGAYYYLAKPFLEDDLRSVVNTALRDRCQQKLLLSTMDSTSRTLGLLQQGTFKFKTRDNGRDLSALIANALGSNENLVMGLPELMINAVEHGNLAITYEEKSRLQAAGTWREEVERRLKQEHFATRCVEVTYSRGPDITKITISDEGEGFDWQRYLDFDPTRISDSHGRGIAIAKNLCFDSLEYVGCGNSVSVTVNSKQ